MKLSKLFFPLLLFSSCQLYTDDNHQLAGYWKLTAVDSLHNGVHVDLSQRSIFWAIQTDLLALRDNDTVRDLYICRFQFDDNTLRVYEPRGYEKASGDTLLSTPDRIRHFGINSLDETFAVRSLQHQSLTLSSPSLTLHFRKF